MLQPVCIRGIASACMKDDRSVGGRGEVHFSCDNIHDAPQFLAQRHIFRPYSNVNVELTHPVMRRSFVSLILFALLSGAFSTEAAQAQERANPGRVFSLNPFALLFGSVSAEYEHRVSPTLAVAVAGSQVDFDDNKYTNLDIKGRLYPNERALNGFGLAASAGVTSVRSREFRDFICDPDCRNIEETRTYTSPTFALEITYQWLLGTQRSTSIIVGGGLKRLMAGKRTLGNDSRFVPTGKVNVGYAF